MLYFWKDGQKVFDEEPVPQDAIPDAVQAKENMQQRLKSKKQKKRSIYTCLVHLLQ